MEERKPVSLEHLYTWENGQTRWLEMRAYPVPGGLAVFWRDISERKVAEERLRASEERQAFLLRLSDDFRAHPDEEAVGRTCVEAIARHMAVNRCYITGLSSELSRGLVGPEYYEPDLQPISGVHRYANYPDAMRALMDGVHFVTSDVDHDPRLSAADKASIGGGLGLQAMISAPLNEGEGNSIWALTVGSAQPRAWTSDDHRLVQEVGERTWAAIHRARAEAALRERDERNAFLVRFSDAVRSVSDPAFIGTGLHRHDTAGLPTEEVKPLSPAQPLAEQRPAEAIRVLELKHSLCEIEPDHANFAHRRRQSGPEQTHHPMERPSGASTASEQISVQLSSDRFSGIKFAEERDTFC
jgi:hypothetical protein